MDETGTLTLAQAYQPYGETLSSTGDSPSNYAFAGEWRDASGLDYLRARYYAPWQGRFLTKDVWPGDYARPLTLNKWNYVVANPVNLTDPTGMFPDYCTMYPNRMLYEDCVRDHYNVKRPWNYGKYLVGRMQPSGCGYPGAIPYSTVGYIEGRSVLALTHSFGEELVFDFATMQSATFRYEGIGISASIGVGVNLYAGVVGLGFPGFNSNGNPDYNVNGIDEYSGGFVSVNVGISVNPFPGASIGGGVMAFVGTATPIVGGVAVYVGGSVGLGIDFGPIGPDIGIGVVDYVMTSGPGDIRYKYVDSSGFRRINTSNLIGDISSGAGSPWGSGFGPLGGIVRQNMIDPGVINLIEAYEALYNADKY